MPKLESANVVLNGNFNPYIISPEWLADQKIWQADSVQLELGAIRKDGVQFNGEGTDWYVSSDRLVVASTTIDCGEVAERVLVALPHTPMIAVGCNFVYQELSPDVVYPVFDAIQKITADETSLRLLRWGIVLHQDNTRIDVSLTSGDQGTTIAFNHHRQANTTSEAMVAAERFGDDKKRSQDLLQKLFNQEVG